MSKIDRPNINSFGNEKKENEIRPIILEAGKAELTAVVT